MTERNRPGGESYHRCERRGEPPPYHRSARFAGERPAGVVYAQIQDAILTGPLNDLSVFRLLLAQVYHVTVLGQTPPDELKQRLEAILAAGDPAELPQDILHALTERRRQSIRQGGWVERHFR